MNRFDLALLLLSFIPVFGGFSLFIAGGHLKNGALCVTALVIMILGFYASIPILDAMSMADGKARYQLVAHPDGSKAWEFVRDQPSK